MPTVHLQSPSAPLTWLKLGLPGVADAGDIMGGLDLGLTHFKFFPAAANGGVPALRSLIGPFQGARICPTGGVTQQTASEWLRISEVLCVGGSWLVLAGVPDTKAITARAIQASALQLSENTQGRIYYD